MLVIGAQGHAKEVWSIVKKNNIQKEWFFYDDVTFYSNPYLFGYPIINNFEDVKPIFFRDNKFILAMGGTVIRKHLVQKFREIGGELKSVISKSACISEFGTISNGVNIMSYSSVLGNAFLEEGVLLNAYASVHHDSRVGEFTEISPGARILGNCKIGNMCSIGTNAVILPNIRIAHNITIGAGAVVTKDLIEPGVYYGIPATKQKGYYE